MEYCRTLQPLEKPSAQVQRFVALLREQDMHHISQVPREALDALLQRGAKPPVFEGCHFLLDEFQDTDDVQFQLVLRLATDEKANACRLTVVGDVDQAIFSWRGADPKILEALQACAAPLAPRLASPRPHVASDGGQARNLGRVSELLQGATLPASIQQPLGLTRLALTEHHRSTRHIVDACQLVRPKDPPLRSVHGQGMCVSRVQCTSDDLEVRP